MPVTGHRIGIQELRSQRSINFSWSPVQGANAYIFTLYQQSAAGRRQVMQRPPLNSTMWILDDIAELGQGIFFWQVEALSVNQSGTILRRGSVGESSFTVDIPSPGPVLLEEPGILYGN